MIVIVQMSDDDVFDENEFESQPTPSSKRASKRKKPKVSVDWNDENMNKLIACVEVHECLWNASNPDYKNKNIRNNLWREMAENNFDSTFGADDLLAKWTNMRIQFKSYAAKKKQTKSGQGVENKVAWKFYNSMMFIEKAEESQTARSESNLVIEFK